MVVKNNIIEFFVNFYAGRLNYILSAQTKSFIFHMSQMDFFDFADIKEYIKKDIQDYLSRLHFQKVAAHRKKELYQKVLNHFSFLIPRYNVYLDKGDTVVEHNYLYTVNIPFDMVHGVFIAEQFKTVFKGDILEQATQIFNQ